MNKSGAKSFLFGGARGGEASTAQSQKVFLLLFVHKRSLPFRFDMTCPEPDKQMGTRFVGAIRIAAVVPNDVLKDKARGLPASKNGAPTRE